VVIAGANGIDIIAQGKKTHTATKYTPSSAAISADASCVAVGAEDGKVYLYKHTSGSLTEAGVLSNNRSAVTALAFDSAATLLAAGESSGKIQVYDVASQTLKIAHWVFHSARINDIRFSPDGTHAVSASLDTHVYVWSVAKPMKNIAVKNAHANGVQAVAWLADDEFASAGADAAVRTWKLKRHDGA
jgi:WD40 repeat protein